MSFYTVKQSWDGFDFLGYLESVDKNRVESILDGNQCRLKDFLALISDAATPLLEQMAVAAAAVTRRHFGNAISLFSPLYVSNICENACRYCSFAHTNPIQRKHLTLQEVRAECVALSATGMRNILILTGESRRSASVEHLIDVVRIACEYFASIGIEVYPLDTDDYKRLIDAGVDSLTLFQETYNEQVYQDVHSGGPKVDFQFRLDAPERACRAGIISVNLGALLGLTDFRRDAFFTALHIAYLQERYPSVEIALSLPRLRPLAGNFSPVAPVGDRHFVQLLTAFRIMFPTIGITLSTRESATFRDNLMPLGVSRMSAGVSTAVGTHSDTPSITQFEIADQRSVAQMQAAIKRLGFQPVMHNWNHRLLKQEGILCE